MAVRSALLTFGTLFAICLWGLSVYSADAMIGNVPADGYGITAAFDANQD